MKVTNPTILSAGSVKNVNLAGPRIKRTIFTASGTFTADPEATMTIVRCVGGGGGGIQVAQPSTGYSLAGRGGHSGGYAESLLTPSHIGVSQTVTIGTGGSGSVADSSPYTGNPGTDTSFGSLVIAKGSPVTYVTLPTNVTSDYQAGGASNLSTGDITKPTTIAPVSCVFSNTSISPPTGANSEFGIGGVGGFNTAGGLATGYGSGGGGAGSVNGGAPGAASDGMPGICIIDEYY